MPQCSSQALNSLGRDGPESLPLLRRLGLDSVPVGSVPPGESYELFSVDKPNGNYLLALEKPEDREVGMTGCEGVNTDAGYPMRSLWLCVAASCEASQKQARSQLPIQQLKPCSTLPMYC